MSLLRELFTKRAPVAGDSPPVADAPPVVQEPSGADMAFVQGILDNAARTMADGFVGALLAEGRIVPAAAEQWRSAFITALRTDGGGQIAASASGAVLEGEMTAQVRALASAQPRHTLTQSVLPSAPDGSVIVPDPGQAEVAERQRLIDVYRAVGGFGGTN